MKEHVVYFLGAGFSAPLGLPLTSTFVGKSKDLHRRSRSKYGHFADVFSQIDSLSKIKNYFNADLSNIEEVLSILEIESFVTGDQARSRFVRYLCDTIAHYTPRPTVDPSALPSNWRGYPFSGSTEHCHYGNFVAALLTQDFERDGTHGLVRSRERDDAPVTYSVVTTNYDCVLETFADALRSYYGAPSDLLFLRSGESAQGNRDHCTLSKLHGSVDTEDIVPPTWNKSSNPALADEWDLALTNLGKANHIRIIGYSLPDSDTYVRYLLKAAALASEHLKTVHVLCVDDPVGTVQARYDSFVKFPGYKFLNRNVSMYLTGLTNALAGHNPPRPTEALELVHSGNFSYYD